LNDLIEKRKNPRVDVIWPIKVSTNDGQVKGETVNISLDGMSIYCNDPLPFNEALSISIEPLNQSVIELSGKVIWSDSYGMDEGKSFAMGVSFLEINDEDRQRFVQFRELVSFLFR
jgi:c-di-GMP-binding flagellar brake protein YcgR